MPRPRSSSRIQPATLSRKYRSWVTATTVPLYSARKRSSQKTDSASRWFVGSSSSSRSGALSSSRQSATRRRSPPESVVTSRSPSGQAQRVHRVIELLFELPCAATVDLVLHLRLLGEQRVEVRVGLGELRGDLVEAVEQVAQLAHAVLDVLAHGLRGVELGLLLEQADGRVGRQLGDAGRRLFLAGHDPQHRRLARAVRAEHADLGAGKERQRDVRQHLPVGAVELVDLVHRVDVFAAHRLATIPSWFADPAGLRFGV